MSKFNERKWFSKHNKSNKLGLSDSLMAKLRQYFNALDLHGYDHISSEDLEDPLIVFGMCEDKKEVENLVKSKLRDT
jgi:Ca2+-binding EF-hand superfamily protein